MIRKLENIFQKIQENILVKFEEFEENPVRNKSLDSWIRKEGGGGNPVHLIRDISMENCETSLKSYQTWGIRIN